MSSRSRRTLADTAAFLCFLSLLVFLIGLLVPSPRGDAMSILGSLGMISCACIFSIAEKR